VRIEGRRVVIADPDPDSDAADAALASPPFPRGRPRG
jgi:hypothetical protein